MSRVNQIRRDRLWLKARRGGMPAVQIARRWQVSAWTVYNGIERARALEKPVGTGRQREPELVPLYPVTPLTPRSACPHRGPIRKGSRLNCEVCNRSGLDHLPLFRRRSTDPKPEKKPSGPKQPKPTRKQRRARGCLVAAG